MQVSQLCWPSSSPKWLPMTKNWTGNEKNWEKKTLMCHSHTLRKNLESFFHAAYFRCVLRLEKASKRHMMSHVHLWSWSYATCLGFQLSSPARALQPHVSPSDLMIGNLIKLWEDNAMISCSMQVYTNIPTCSVYSFDYSILLKQRWVAKSRWTRTVLHNFFTLCTADSLEIGVAWRQGLWTLGMPGIKDLCSRSITWV